jgi:chromosome segregation ATPase
VKGLLKDAKAEKDAATAKVETLNTQLAEAKAKYDVEVSRVTDQTKRAAALREMLMTVLDSIAHARDNNAAAVSTNIKEDSTCEQAAVAAAKTALTSLVTELQEMTRCKASLQSAASVLETSLQRLEGQVSAAQAATQQEKDRVAVLEALLATTKVELADAVRERDNQMNALAKVIATQGADAGSSGTLKTELETAKREVSELTERCANLRQMNEELLGMLERMYADQEQK